jgi:hypothetical protein
MVVAGDDLEHGLGRHNGARDVSVGSPAELPEVIVAPTLHRLTSRQHTREGRAERDARDVGILDRNPHRPVEEGRGLVRDLLRVIGSPAPELTSLS